VELSTKVPELSDSVSERVHKEELEDASAFNTKYTVA
jgi:hypothetical protein